MFGMKHMHKDESGQTALETAIILIAFIVVASVFAFAILSAGSASTEKAQQGINAGLEGVQSSMAVKGAVIAKGPTTVGSIIFTLALVSGGDPVDLTAAAADRKMIIGYRDATQLINDVDWTVDWIGANDTDDLLEDGELAEITVTGVAAASLGPNTAFTLEVKPPTGAVLQINRTTPASVETVNELH